MENAQIVLATGKNYSELASQHKFNPFRRVQSEDWLENVILLNHLRFGDSGSYKQPAGAKIQTLFTKMDTENLSKFLAKDIHGSKGELSTFQILVRS
jgi:hypothetical protein